VSEPESITLDLAGYGHDGICDYGWPASRTCTEAATMVVLSATAPDGWKEGAPRASLSFTCARHAPLEPRATRADARRTARIIKDVDGTHPAWARLLDVYPEPLALTELAEE
jgi:hypothetical protein